MASGIEIAALVIGTFPLIISGLEHYGGCFESMKEWLRFRAQFTIFLNSLYRQKIFFRQNIEDLLSSVIRSEHEMAVMLDDPTDPGWRNPELETRLKERLCGEGEYDCYMDMLSSFHTTLWKLENKLQVKQGKLESIQSSNVNLVRLEFEYRRFTYTLGKKRLQKLMSELERYNEDLKKLLGNSDRLGPMRNKRSIQLPKFFQRFRAQATSLHNAIAKALRCDCLTPHSAELLLSKNSERASPGYHDASETVKLHVYFPLASRRWVSTSTLPNNDRTRYVTQVETVLDSTFESEPSEQLFDNASTVVSFRSGSGTKATQHSRRVSFLSSQKESEVPSIPNGAGQIFDLCASLQSQDDSQMCLGVLNDGQGRCHIIHKAAASALSEHQPHQMLTLKLLLAGPPASNTKRPEGRQPVSSPLLATVSRQQRLEIALTLAKALLQLHPGPWLKHPWTKNDIYFFQTRTGAIETHHPILVSDFVKEKPTASSTEMPDHPTAAAIAAYRESKALLQSLGILIMELWFGQGIQSLSFRAQFLGPDGQENEFTDFNTAQKWQEQTLGEGGWELHNITRRCIYCVFNAASQDLNDEALRLAVYDEVIQGLERILKGYEPA